MSRLSHCVLTSDHILIFEAATLQDVSTFRSQCFLYCAFQECSPPSLSLSVSFFLSLFLSLPLFLFLSSEHEIHYHLSNRATQNIMSKQAQTDAHALIQKQTVITVDRGRMHWWNAPVCVCVCVCLLTVECAVDHHNQFVIQCINCMLIFR